MARRAAREPVAYILGRRGFRHLELEVDRRVLIPRPETELLVEVGLTLPPGARVLDVGTGSGAVALALADERPDLSVVGRGRERRRRWRSRERTPPVSAWRCEFVAGDLLGGPLAADAVLANLPYVAAGDMGTLAPEITRYEPALALFAGDDGLDLVRRLIGMLARRPVGGAGGRALTRPRRVGSLLAEAGYGAVEVCETWPGTSGWCSARR